MVCRVRAGIKEGGEERARELLAEAGFRNVDVHRIEGDINNAYYVATK